MYIRLETEEYPYNLLKEVFSSRGADEEFEKLKQNPPPDLEEGLNRVLETINPKEKEAIYLRYRDKLTYREIGEMLQCSPRTIRRHLVKGCAKLYHPSRRRFIQYGLKRATSDILKREAEEALYDVVKTIASIQFARRANARYRKAIEDSKIGTGLGGSIYLTATMKKILISQGIYTVRDFMRTDLEELGKRCRIRSDVMTKFRALRNDYSDRIEDRVVLEPVYHSKDHSSFHENSCDDWFDKPCTSDDDGGEDNEQEKIERVYVHD